jgi:hypothetical protein
LFSLAYWEALVFPVFLTVHRVARFNHSTPHKRIPGA